jgi:hypothetical protein
MNIEACTRKMRIPFAAMILVCTLNLAAAGAQRSSRNPHRQRAQKTCKPQAKSSAAAPASTIAGQSPAPAPPAVAYREGLLGITAQNASLGKILDKVRESTGAVIEAPVLEERVSVQITPRPPAQAIAMLLEGLRLNYATLGGANDQDRIQRVIVTLEPARDLQPTAPVEASVLEDVAAKARAQALIQFAEETGGDEGVWESKPQSPVETREPSSPAPSMPSHQ